MIKGNWTICVDGRNCSVKVTEDFLYFSVYVDDVLAYKTGFTPFVNLYAFPREICRFQKDGYEYVVSVEGYSILARFALRVNGVAAERINDAPMVAPTSEAK